MKGSIDQGLKEQALMANVAINFEKTIDPKESDIVATGPRPLKNMPLVDKGIIFKTDLPDMAVAIINDRAAYQGYSYLLIVNGSACLCTCMNNADKQLGNCFDFTKKYFTKKYDLKIENPQPVGGIFNFSVNNKYKKGKSCYVGEAAGLQDFLYGFGMRTAFNSGYLAAKSIILRKDYKELAQEKFQNYLKAGVVNRFGWENTDTDNYSLLLEKLDKDNNNVDIPRSIYNLNLAQRLEYPIASGYIRKRYPEIFE